MVIPIISLWVSHGTKSLHYHRVRPSVSLQYDHLISLLTHPYGKSNAMIFEAPPLCTLVHAQWYRDHCRSCQFNRIASECSSDSFVSVGGLPAGIELIALPLTDWQLAGKKLTACELAESQCAVSIIAMIVMAFPKVSNLNDRILFRYRFLIQRVESFLL